MLGVKRRLRAFACDRFRGIELPRGARLFGSPQIPREKVDRGRLALTPVAIQPYLTLSPAAQK